MTSILLAALLILPGLSLVRASRPLALALAAGVALLGVAHGLVSASGLFWLALLFLSAWCLDRGLVPAAAALVILIPVGAALAFGVAPGFSPLVIWEPVALKAGSELFGLRLRVEKVLLGVAVLTWFVRPVSGISNTGAALLRGLPIALGTLLVVGALALALGYVEVAPGLPPPGLLLLWAAVNLLVVCTIEEGFFRGVVQERLSRCWPLPAAVVLAALLFGLAHAGGGLEYVLLATVAGAGYGAAYQLAGRRIEAAILAHFLLNTGHLIGFTYPYAA